MFITLTGGDWSITIASSSREEEVDSGEEMELASLCPTNLSSLFSRTKLLEIFDKSVVFCGFPKLSFKSGGEGAPVTRPPLDWVFSLHGSDGVFWQLLMLSASFWTETEVLNDPVEVNRDEDTVGKDNTPEIKKIWGLPLKWVFLVMKYITSEIASFMVELVLQTSQTHFKVCTILSNSNTICTLDHCSH